MRIVGITLLLALAACSGNSNEPSEKEMSRLILETMKSLTKLAGGGEFSISSFEKHQCQEAAQGRMLCGFTLKAQVKEASGQTRSQTVTDAYRFVKSGNSWAISK